jgi:hypothetical protein
MGQTLLDFWLSSAISLLPLLRKLNNYFKNSSIFWWVFIQRKELLINNFKLLYIVVA